jgi:tetratricopeptide (TPR) repeat protein
MKSHLPPSLQEILKHRQKTEFVGREEHITHFRENLGLSLEDGSRRFVYSIFGQGGVGKSFLLRHLSQIAEQNGAITALIDETTRDVPSAMGNIAAHLEFQGQELKSFNSRFRVYRERRQELEADPEAPKGLPTLIGRVIGKGGLHLARRIPVGGVAFEMIEEEDVANLMGDVASYVSRKLTNKDEVQLVLRPDEILTPLFIKDLRNIAAQRLVALFLDTYERTSHFLDAWLRDIFEGRHGSVFPNVLFTIGGQYELDRNQWAPYEALVGRVSLELFTETETREYLTHKEITDEEIVKDILHLSGRLPLLVATLAAETPRTSESLADPTETAVKRFFKWVEEPERRQIALDCSLTRHFNRDVVSTITNEANSSDLFDWLVQMPFVLSKTEGWVYHSVAREQMLRQKKHQTPRGWEELHRKLALFYKRMQDGIGQEFNTLRNPKWQGFKLEELYHRLCSAPESELLPASEGFLTAFESDNSFAQQWGAAVQQAGRDVESATLEDYGTVLVEGVTAYEQKRYEDAAGLFTFLLENDQVSEGSRDSLFFHRGALYSSSGQQAKALRDLDQAVTLSPDEPRNLVLRGRIHQAMKRYQEALEDLNRSLAIAPGAPTILLARGRILRDLSRYKEAKLDFESAIELDVSLKHSALKEIGHGSMATNEPELATNAFLGAIEADPICSEAWEGLLQSYQSQHHRSDIPRLLERIQSTNASAEMLGVRSTALGMNGFYQEALKGFNRAIQANNKLDWLYRNRGYTFFRSGRYDKALSDYNSALAINDRNVGTLMLRAEVYRELERFDDSFADYDRVVELDRKKVGFFIERALTHRAKGQYQDALQDLDAGLLLEGGEAALKFRGEILIQLERYDEALEALDRAVSFKRDVSSLLGRADVLRCLERYDEALEDLDSAMTFDDGFEDAFIIRGRIHRALGRYTDALTDIRHNIEIQPRMEHRGQTEIGHIFEAMNKPEKAINAFKRALFIHPDCADCWRSLAGVLQKIYPREHIPNLLRSVTVGKDQSFLPTRGAVLRTLGYAKEALAEFGKALALDGKSIRALEGRASAHLSLANYNEAVIDFERLAKLNPSKSAGDFIDYGRALSNLGRYEEAIKIFEELLTDESRCYVALYYIAIANFRWKGLAAAHQDIQDAREGLVQMQDKEPIITSYCLGGLEAVLGHTSAALRHLRASFKLDCRAKEWIRHDLAWLDIRELPEFVTLLSRKGT